MYTVINKSDKLTNNLSARQSSRRAERFKTVSIQALSKTQITYFLRYS